MASNVLKAIDLDSPKKTDIWDEVESTVEHDAQYDAKNYVKSAKVDLGGE